MKPNHTDERGTITDLLVTPEYSITHITFTEGAVRGNHYHKETTQFDVILNGNLQVSVDGVVRFLKPKEGVMIPPNKKHAYKAVEPSEMISICWGVRKGEDYEKDVFRLETPLL